MDIEKLKAEHPDLYKQVVKAGFDDGVKAERDRIKAIEDMAMPGHDELVTKAKFDTGVTAESLAVQIVKAEKQKGKDFLNKREQDSQDVNDVAQDEPELVPESSEDDEKRARAKKAAAGVAAKSKASFL